MEKRATIILTIHKVTELLLCVCVVTKHKQPPPGHPSARWAQVVPKFVHKINKSDSLKQIMFHPAPEKKTPQPSHESTFLRLNKNLAFTFDIYRPGFSRFAVFSHVRTD